MYKIYLDTNIWIYHFETTTKIGDLASDLVRRSIEEADGIIVSSLFFAEFAAGRNAFDQGKLLRELDAVPNLEILPVDPFQALYAAELRRTYHPSDTRCNPPSYRN